MFDNRGQGMSTDADPSPLTIDSMAASTVDLITALGVRQPDIWGTSMGGDVVLTIVAKHPGAVRRAVSLAGSPGGNSSAIPKVRGAAPCRSKTDVLLAVERGIFSIASDEVHTFSEICQIASYARSMANLLATF